MASPLQKEFEFYIANQDELVGQYSGKVIVIKDQCVIGAYTSVAEAVRETSKLHPLGTFLVQKCEAGTQAYTQMFHSRVAFA